MLATALRSTWRKDGNVLRSFFQVPEDSKSPKRDMHKGEERTDAMGQM
jgi:hypothetical protein